MLDTYTMPNGSHQLDTAQYQAPVTLPPVQRRGFSGWIHDHPFAAALLGCVLLIVLGSIMVLRRFSVSPAASSDAWGGASITVLNPTSYSERPPQQYQPTAIDRQISEAPVYTYNPLPVSTGPSYSEDQSGATAADTGGFDFNAFVEMLSQGTSQGKATSVAGGASTDNGAYSFIPSGIISTSTPTEERSEAQQKLYDFGNEAGSYVQSYEDQHANQAQVLKNHVEDRTNPDKVAQVIRIANDLRNVGNSLAQIEEVPDAISEQHALLAQSYIEIGTKLAPVANAKTDQQFIDAIQTYNAAADEYAKNYISLVETFGSFGVKFDPNDPGSVFQFTQIQ